MLPFSRITGFFWSRTGLKLAYICFHYNIKTILPCLSLFSNLLTKLLGGWALQQKSPKSGEGDFPENSDFQELVSEATVYPQFFIIHVCRVRLYCETET